MNNKPDTHILIYAFIDLDVPFRKAESTFLDEENVIYYGQYSLYKDTHSHEAATVKA
jgi:hypothetical protein